LLLHSSSRRKSQVNLSARKKKTENFFLRGFNNYIITKQFIVFIEYYIYEVDLVGSSLFDIVMLTA